MHCQEDSKQHEITVLKKNTCKIHNLHFSYLHTLNSHLAQYWDNISSPAGLCDRGDNSDASTSNLRDKQS